MEKEEKKYKLPIYITIGFGIILAGVANFVSERPTLQIIFIVAGVILIVVPVCFNLIVDKIIIPRLGKSILEGIKITMKEGASYNYAEESYEIAKSKGGILSATHILKYGLSVKDDVAIKKLNEGVDIDLTFRRLFMFTNKLDEREWMKEFFALETPQLRTEAYFWKDYDLTPPLSLLGALPRVNFQLYKSADSTIYRSLIGFESIRFKNKKLEKNLSVSITSGSKDFYEAAKKYFDSVAINPELGSSNSFEIYDDLQVDRALGDREHFVIKQLLDLAQQHRRLQHVGAFGGTAQSISNVARYSKKSNYVSDVDILLIWNGSIEELKSIVTKSFNEIDVKVDLVFGDDPNHFYYSRKRDEITVDIEIFTPHSEFYRTHQLLGYSIFAYYSTLYSSSDKSLDETIWIPTEPISKEKRLSIFSNNRKSINEFINRINERKDEPIDPRRVLTINYKNAAWALTGFHPIDAIRALSFLVNETSMTDDHYEKARRILDKSDDIIFSNRSELLEECLVLLKDLKSITFL